MLENKKDRNCLYQAGVITRKRTIKPVTVIESIDENFPKWKSPAYSFISEFHQIFKEEIITILYKLFHKCEIRILLKPFTKGSINWIPK